jgi:hypothetical protein
MIYSIFIRFFQIICLTNLFWLNLKRLDTSAGKETEKYKKSYCIIALLYLLYYVYPFMNIRTNLRSGPGSDIT